LVLEIRKFGDPVLKSRATPVKEFDESLARLAEEMLETMRAHEGVGLAGNQVGRLKRIMVAAVDDKEYVVVNPVIEERSETTDKELEGCLSIPEVHVEVERAAEVKVVGRDVSGDPLEVEASGMLARVLQHEIDHLDGVLILDRTDRESRKRAMREMRERMLAGK
jgi:peptide deformylase